MRPKILLAVLLAVLGLLAVLAGGSSGAPKPSPTSTDTADVSITKTDSPDPVTVGAALTYRIQVSNAGPARATGVVVTDNFPNGVSFVSAQATQGSCTVSSNKKKVTCALGSLDAGGAGPVYNPGPVYSPTGAGVTINVLAPKKPGTITNIASVDRDQKDPKKGNNTARATTRVIGPASVTCHGRTATIVGTPGPDLLTGTPGNDVIFARAGNDRIYSFGGRDVICAGGGNDLIRSGGRGDTVLAGPGADRVFGGAGADELRGGRGNDRLKGGRGADLLAGGRGRDVCIGGPGSDTLRSC
jgi:uncharacterized repeat protein (TIGR01451 family)